MNRPFQKRGFTLVELMVSLVMVIVLAALTLFSIQKMKKSAEMAQTISRIRGLSHANAVYASAHGGKYVPIFAFDEQQRASVQWHYNKAFLEPLVGSAGYLDHYEVHEGADGLPESVLDPVVVREQQKYWGRISASYGYNQENTPGGSWGQANTSRSHTTATLREPSKTFAFITATDWIAKYGGRYLWRRTPHEGKTPDGKIAYRHGNKAVVAFFDGHTETLTMDEMRKIDRRGGLENVFWGGTRH